MRLTTVALVLYGIPAFGQMSDETYRKFEEPEKHIVRLPPTAFSSLPRTVVRELQRRGCRILQSPEIKKPHNVIRGSFAKRGQTDWAVLCSVKGVSRILVFWAGSGKQPAAVASAEDRHYLQGIGGNEIGYSRGISPVGKGWIMLHYREFGGPKPPPIYHQGIDDAFLGKASTTWYFYRGKWQCLSGAD
jgi:hypothetical protein